MVFVFFEQTEYNTNVNQNNHNEWNSNHN